MFAGKTTALLQLVQEHEVCTRKRRRQAGGRGKLLTLARLASLTALRTRAARRPKSGGRQV
jgi:hypothetical protein